MISHAVGDNGGGVHPVTLTRRGYPITFNQTGLKIVRLEIGQTRNDWALLQANDDFGSMIFLMFSDFC